jgi:hypothetical protein
VNLEVNDWKRLVAFVLNLLARAGTAVVIYHSIIHPVHVELESLTGTEHRHYWKGCNYDNDTRALRCIDHAIIAK